MTRSVATGPVRSATDALRQTLVVAALACSATGALAASPDPDALADVATSAQCRVPDDTALVDAPLPRVAQRLKSLQPLTIVVIGSGSAAGSGTSRPDAAFPRRLEARLERAYPKSKPRLVVLAEMGQTASAMLARLPRDVVPLRPALVIWQTGSSDAAHSVPPADFGASLERGIALLHADGSDVLLVDSQFSPRASLLVNTDEYREAVRWNARQSDLPLLRRYDAMQYWSTHEVFDLDAEDKASQIDNADRIHDCVAGLLFRLIQRGVGEKRS